MTPESITPHEFLEFETKNSRAAHNEWLYCIDPEFTRYRVMVSTFLTNNVFPTYRLAKSGTHLTSIFQDREASPISFVALACRLDLIESLLREGFISTNDTVLAYHCSTCGVRVVKDGIHRLCKWAAEGTNREITVYEVSSRDWARAPVDMQNYCRVSKMKHNRCSTSDARKKTRAPVSATLPMSFSLNREQVREFARANQRAMLLMHRGASDYVGARCCLLNGVFSGLELGAQAVEKYLKAMLLFSSPTSNPRQFNHKLPLLANTIQERGIADLAEYLDTIARLQAHYQARYPENPDKATSASTDEIRDLDALMNRILEVMPVPEEIMLRSGIYSRAIASRESDFVSPDERWLLQDNPQLLAKLPALVNRTKEWFKYAYPSAA